MVDIVVGSAINHLIKRRQIKPSVDSGKKPYDHGWYSWGISTMVTSAERGISLGVNNPRGFCSVLMIIS